MVNCAICGCNQARAGNGITVCGHCDVPHGGAHCVGCRRLRAWDGSGPVTMPPRPRP